MGFDVSYPVSYDESMEKCDAIVEFSITPIGSGAHLSDAIARCTRIVRESGLKNELHAMGTLLEGDLDECLQVVRSCVEEALANTPRVSTSIRIDTGEGRSGIQDRVRSVEDKL